MRIDHSLHALLGQVYKAGNVIFSPDNSFIYSPVGHRVTCFALSHTGESRTLRFETYQPIVRIALSGCGRLLIAADEKGGCVLYNTDNDNIVARIAMKEGVTAIAFSPNNEMLAVATGTNRVQLWRVPNAATNKRFVAFSLVKTMTGHADQIKTITWSRCGRYIVTAGADMVARVYKVDAEGHVAPTVLQGHKHALVGAFFSYPPNDHVLESMEGAEENDVCGIVTVGKDGAAFEWRFDMKRGKLLTRHGEAVEHLLSLERDIGLPENTNEEQSERETYRPWIASCQFNADLGLLIIGHVNGSFALFKQGLLLDARMELVHGLSLSTRHIDAVAISPDGQWVAFGSGPTGQLLVWEWGTETYIFKQSSNVEYRTMAYSPDGLLLAGGGVDGTIRVWSVQTGQSVCVFKAGDAAVRSLCFSKHGRVLISAGDDGIVRAWDGIRLKSNSPPFRQMFCPDPQTRLTTVAIDGAGEVVVAGGAKGEILVWSLRDQQLIDTLFGHESSISALSFDPVGTGRLMSAGWDGTVRLWSLFDRDKKMMILENHSDVLTAQWRPDGREIAAACLSGVVNIWDAGDVGVSSADYQLARSIDVRRDITDRALSGAHVRSLAYTIDGQFVFMAGAFPAVMAYDAQSGVMIRQFPLTRVKKSQKQVNESAEAIHLAYSSHGKQFSVLSREGLLCFLNDDHSSSAAFDPFDLDVDVTPDRVIELIDSNEHLHALSMACRLNMRNMIQRVLESVPGDLIPTVCRSLHKKHIEKVLCLIADGLSLSARTELYILWLDSMVSFNLDYLRRQVSLTGTLRVIEKRTNELLSVVGKQVKQLKVRVEVDRLEESLLKNLNI